jgi:agmatine/peptidylarginine deiminase
VPWSGISDVNSLLVDRTLFVPRFGLGEAEEAIFEELDAALPPEYQVVPVYARHMLLYNGGVHCSVAIVRH